MACRAGHWASSMLQEIHTRNMALQYRVDSHYGLIYQPLQKRLPLAVRMLGLVQDHKL